MSCRGCGSDRLHLVIDLGPTPIANALVSDPDAPEVFYPLRAFVCETCFLMQIPAIDTPVFTDEYPYFSSANPALVKNARVFVVDVMARLKPKYVLEIASNDGYLLQHFPDDVDVHGFEPSVNVAEVAMAAGINTTCAFFGSTVAAQVAGADLIIANNVLAHVPDLHDFVEGLRIALAPNGVISLEFPHVLGMLNSTQFDTIYHEHYSYFSITALAPVFAAHGLTISKVRPLNTHGGSLRVELRHTESADGSTPCDGSFSVIDLETAMGISAIGTYDAFARKAQACRRDTLRFFDELPKGQRVAGYTAPAKASTFLNYCGLRSDQIEWTVDAAPAKVGKFIPGTRIPIVSEDDFFVRCVTPPDILFVFAWNWLEQAMARTRALGFTGKFLTAIPKLVCE